MRLNLLIIALLASIALWVINYKAPGQHVQVEIQNNQRHVESILLDKRKLSKVSGSQNLFELKNVKPGAGKALAVHIAGCPVLFSKQEIVESDDIQTLTVNIECTGHRDVKLLVNGLNPGELKKITLRDQSQTAQNGEVIFTHVPVGKHHLQVFFNGCKESSTSINLNVEKGDTLYEQAITLDVTHCQSPTLSLHLLSPQNPPVNKRIRRTKPTS